MRTGRTAAVPTYARVCRRGAVAAAGARGGGVLERTPHARRAYTYAMAQRPRCFALVETLVHHSLVHEI